MTNARTPAPRNTERQHPRRAITLDIHAFPSENDARLELIFESLDLSIGGIFFRSDLLLELGDQLDVVIPLPDGYRVKARGKIVWVTRDAKMKGNAGMGLEFTTILEADRERLAKFIAENETRFVKTL
ncbi:MAG: PilZ domain-containing protein [Clostridia bacterium]|nr:PilZ domain-containing protein [Deltaproteobacteria bacterium]